MRVQDLLAELKSLEVVLVVDNGKLKIKIPKGVSISHLVNDIKDAKDELIGILSNLRNQKYTEIKRQEKKECYQLSSAQKRLFFLQQLELESISYNMPIVLPLGKDIEIERLENTFSKLINRHDSLRTSFRIINNEPNQIVSDNLNFRLEYTEVSKDKLDQTIKKYIRPFDLSNDILIRACLISVLETGYFLVVDMHHIISDGISGNLITEDFLLLYDDVKIQPLKLQYKDFSEWQNQLIYSGELKKQEDYWKEVFSDDFSRLQLQTDFERPESFTFKGNSCKFSLGKSQTTYLKGLGNEFGSTLYMNVLAILNVLFYKITNQEDIIIGSGIAGRPHPDLQRISGMFVNTLAMRNNLQGDKTFTDFLKQVVGNSLKAFENQDIQFEDLVDLLSIERDVSRNPIFDICMVVQNFGEKNNHEIEENKSDLTSNISNYKKETAKFDMIFFVTENSNSININIEYYSDIFKKSTIEKYIKHFIKILEKVSENPSVKIKDIDILEYEEKQYLLNELNIKPSEYPHEKTIHEIFEEQVDRSPDSIAIISNNEQITYGELDERSNQLANYLCSELGVTVGESVGIYMNKGIEMIVSMLGILKSGCGYLPLSVSYPESRIVYMLNDTATRIIIGEKRFVKELNKLQWECAELKAYMCLDSINVSQEQESQSGLNDRKLWEYVGEESIDEITGGGWNSSYTGQPLPKVEMDEFGDNILKKLEPIITPQTRILEIGCASGISMFRLAPKVELYYGTDISETILEKNQVRIRNEQHGNIIQKRLAAHEIDQIDQKDFDLVIVNSVVQCFDGHNYLKNVIHKILDLMKPEGILFFGDIMDQDKKRELVKDLEEFKRINNNDDNKTKTEWNEELFLSRGFWNDLHYEINSIEKIDFSNKIFTIENELTKFRYDAIIQVNKRNINSATQGEKKNKEQHDQKILESYKKNRLNRVCSSKSLAYIIYTSGSTGKPKGVMVGHQSLVNLSYNHNLYYKITAKENLSQFADFSFDASVWEIFSSLIAGSKLVMINEKIRLDIEKLNTCFEKLDIAIAFLPTQLCEQFMKFDNKSLRILLTGGDKLNFFTKRRYCLYNNYGPTENAVVTARYKVNEKLKNIPIGKPIENNQVFILNEFNQLQPSGTPGELCVSGDSLATGYINNPEMTNEKFLENTFINGERIYKTGDLVKWNKDGYIEFLGRIDHQVKIRGFRIELGEIENVLLNHESITECIVLDRVVNDDKYLFAYIVCKDEFNQELITSYLNSHLPEYMIPSYFIKMDELPVTINGKINRKALPSHEFKANKEYIAPANETEDKLADIWSQVLSIAKEEISVNANFFYIGGHSLKATVLIGKIHKELGVEFPLRDVFLNSTIKDQANKISLSIKKDFIAIPKAIKKDFYSLSSAQKRLYFLQQMDLESITYNIPGEIILPENINRTSVQKIVNKLIEHHENFRTSFKIIEGALMQQICEKIGMEIEECKVSESEIHQNRIQFIRSFDLSKAPLLRVKLLRIENKAVILLFDMHHIISDGTSHEILKRDFLKLMEGEKLQTLKLQYKDFSEWQNSEEQQKRIQKQEKYWLDRFKGDLPLLNLPTDFSRPAVLDNQGAQVFFILNNNENQIIKKWAKDNDATLYMSLLAVFNILLRRLSGQEDIIIGTPIAARCHVDLEGIVGMFVNTLVIRNEVSGNDTLNVFLKKIKKSTIQAYENQEYQFEDLVDKISLNRDISRNPLFDVMFNMLNQNEEESDLSGFDDNNYIHSKANSKFDLTLLVKDNVDQLLLNFNYCVKLFTPDTIERFIGYIKEIIYQLGQNSEKRICEIEIIGKEEKQQLLNDLNGTDTEYPKSKSIYENIEEQVAKNPDNISCILSDAQISYAELNKKANRIAYYLKQLGVEKDTIVSLFFDPSMEMIISIIGVLKSGATFLPINCDFPENRIDYILKDSGSSIVLKDSAVSFNFGKNNDVIDIDKLLVRNDLNDLPNIKNTFNSAYIIYTSGTTGKPKGVIASHRNMINYINWFQKSISVDKKDRAVLTTTYMFDAIYTLLFGVLFSGGRLDLLSKNSYLNPQSLIEFIDKENVTLLKMTPTLFNTIINNITNKRNLGNVRFLMLGGESINPSDVEKFHQHNKKSIIMNHYGPTETTVGSISTIINSNIIPKYIKQSYIGKPIDNTKVYILNDNLQIQPIMVAGELFISGDGLTMGYLNNPELIHEKFINNPFKNGERIYRTGDLARRLPDGNIEFLGRIDNQIKISGFRIELGEIENVLLKHDNIKESIVVAREENGNTSLCAYLICKNELNIDLLRSYLSDILPYYMVPAYYIALDKIPLTVNGKTNYKALPLPELKIGKNYIAPSNRIEEKLRDIWSEVLKISKDEISITSDFFGLGGHSLKATILTNKIHKELSVKYPLKEIFRNVTIKSQAQKISKLSRDAFYAIPKAANKPLYITSSAQKRLFLMQELLPESTAYNMPHIIPLAKEMDKELIIKALKNLVAHHESFRTSFYMENDVPVQKIHDYVEIEVEEYYSNNKDKGIIQKSFIRPFDLSKAPLLRVGFLEVSDADDILLLLDMHHIISDGTSHEILERDFNAFYNNENIEELQLQYKDYSEWQNSTEQQQKIKNQEEYWLNRFKKDIPVLNLPTDYSRPPLQSFEGAIVTFVLSNQETSIIKSFAKDNDLTLYMTFLSIFNLLLSKLTGQKDIIVGTPIAARLHADLEGVVGMFVNTLAMRNEVQPFDSLKNLSENIKQTTLEAFENQDYQFEDLVEEIFVDRDFSRNPLFDVMLNLLNQSDLKEDLSGFDNENLKHIKGASKFDLSLTVYDYGEQILLSYEYCTKLFNPESINRYVQYLKTIINQLPNNIERKIFEFDILSTKEKEELLFEFNDTTVDYLKEKTIHELFEEQVDRTPNNIALISEEEKITYKELDNRSNQIAQYLQKECGITGNESIGLYIDRGVNMMVAIFGILKAGCAYLPIPVSNPEERNMSLINDASLAVIISEKKFVKQLNRYQWDCPAFKSYICLDTYNVYEEKESENGLSDRKLWEYIGEESEDEITGGGWNSSYTGLPISPKEMEEYAENTVEKIIPIINSKTRVLEIGCASGITMFKLAPMVELYYGTDISGTILDKNEKRIIDEGHLNIIQKRLSAHEIDQIEEKDFDLIIINSVIHCFDGHNYLKTVIRKAIDLMKPEGKMYLGDIIDQKLKKALVKDLESFKRTNTNKGFKTKTDWSQELFLSRDFWNDLKYDDPSITKLEFSNKIFTIENELTKYRYDVIMSIEKNMPNNCDLRNKNKNQHDLRHLSIYSNERLSQKVSSQNIAYIIYTSGSTGKPKGVMIEHHSVINRIFWMQKEYPINEKDVLLQKTPIVFDVSVWELFWWSFKGASLCLLKPDGEKSPEDIVEAIEMNKVTTIHFVPSMLSVFLASLDNDFEYFRLSDLRQVFSSGEALKNNQVQLFGETLNKNCATNLINLYGPTEATVDVSNYTCTFGNGKAIVPIGKPIDNTHFCILNNENQLIPIGVSGELCIGGVQLARGYIDNPELTSEKFINHPFKKGERLYRTGDLARWLLDGNIEYLGRIDNQVKIRGFRIELGEIEKTLLKFKNVNESLAIAREENEDKYICAYIICEEKNGNENLRSFLYDMLPEYMVPSHIVELEKWPLTTNGKVNYKALPSPQVKASDDYKAAENEIEEKMVAIWSRVLNIPSKEISVEADFFELGGHSLKVLNVVSAIKVEFGISLPLMHVYKASNIKTIATDILSKEYVSKDFEVYNDENKSKIFCFPPMIGYGLCFAEVARLIPEYCFHAFNYVESDELVKFYANKIEEIDNVNPYILMGYSAGCKLVSLVARELEQRGYEVSNLILIDGLWNEKDLEENRKLKEELIAKELEIFIDSTNEQLKKLSMETLVDQVRSKIIGYNSFIRNINKFEVINANIHFIHSQWNDEIRKEKLEKALNMKEYTNSEIFLYPGNGTHFEMLFSDHIEDNVKIIQKILKGS